MLRRANLREHGAERFRRHELAARNVFQHEVQEHPGRDDLGKKSIAPRSSRLPQEHFPGPLTERLPLRTSSRFELVLFFACDPGARYKRAPARPRDRRKRFLKSRVPPVFCSSIFPPNFGKLFCRQ